MSPTRLGRAVRATRRTRLRGRSPSGRRAGALSPRVGAAKARPAGLALLAAHILCSCLPSGTARHGIGTGPPGTGEAKAAYVTTIQLEGGPLFKPGDVVKGRLVGLEKGRYELAWKDGAGTLWAEEFTGPGDAEFGLELSYPRARYNELALSSAGGGKEAVPGFDIDLPPRCRKGYVRVGDPGGPILLDLAWRLEFIAPPAGTSAVAAISLGDWPPTAVVEARADAAGFRDFVRSRHSLDAVARRWGRTLSGWEDVSPPSSLPDAYTIRRSLAHWGDYFEFLEQRAVSFLRAAKDGLRSSPVAGIPVGFFGMEGSSTPGTPGFDLVGEVVQWRGGPFRPGMARLVSEFLPAGRPLVSRDTPTPYAALRAGLSGSLVQVFRPDEREAAVACEPLARGLGRLLEVSSQPRPSPRDDGMPAAQLALVYSHRSVRASFLLDAAETTHKPTGGWPFPKLRDASWDRVWEGWCALLSDLGVPFVPVTEEAVATGALSSGRFKAAVLVRMLAVSEDAARALGEYAHSGGVLIADAGTGMFDGDLVRVRGSEAQKLFGIEHAADAKFSEVGDRRRMIVDAELRLMKRDNAANWFAPRGPLGVGPAESGLTLLQNVDGARAEGRFGEIPCLTVKAVGGGWAVTLNLAVSAYLELRTLPRGGKGLRDLIASALRRARVRPAVELAYDDKTYPPPSVSAIWDCGATRLVVIARDEHRSAEPARVRLHFASNAPPAAYDSLQGSFFGWTSDVEAELAPGELRVFALLPYQLTSILAEPLGPPADSARSGPEAFEVALRKTGEAPFEFHVLKVTESRELSALVEVSGGRAEFVVPFAQSDPSGLWTLRLRDAATGVRAVRRFTRRTW